MYIWFINPHQSINVAVVVVFVKFFPSQTQTHKEGRRDDDQELF